MIRIELSDCDVARIIAAIRFQQGYDAESVADIVTNGGEYPIPTPEELDAICERLNFADDLKEIAHHKSEDDHSFICLHPWFVNDDGCQEHSDDRAKIDGWNVYTRKPCKIDGFSVQDDQDFNTYEEALAEAQRRAAATGFEIDEY